MAAEQNPYSPPQANVADLERAAPRGKRPLVINSALVVLGLLALLSLKPLLTVVPGINSGEASPMSLAWPIARLLIFIVLGVAIGRGSNWARIVFAVVTAFALMDLLYFLALPYTLPASTVYQRDYFFIAKRALPTVLNLIAVYLLFFPGRSWFAHR
jgi:lysylphosphatidylglycerol synthetase-like protein (DUF2156 family)